MGLGLLSREAPTHTCCHRRASSRVILSGPRRRLGSGNRRRRAPGGASTVGRRTDPFPVTPSHCPRPASQTEPPQDCGRRPWDAARGRWEEPARRPGCCSMAWSILEKGTRGVHGWGQEKGSRTGPWRQSWARVQKTGVQGGSQGRGPGSVEPGRAAQDEGEPKY